MEALLVSEHLQEEKKVSVNGGNHLQDKWLLTINIGKCKKYHPINYFIYCLLPVTAMRDNGNNSKQYSIQQ